MLSWLWTRITAEPVAFAAIVRQGIIVGMAFGLGWTPGQMAVTSLLTEMIISFLARGSVTPNTQVNAKVQAALMTPVPGVQPAVAN